MRRFSKHQNNLAHVYPGLGGCAQTAGIKIQLEYDLHSGQFLNFQVGPGKHNDKTFGTDCLATLRPGDLCIRDLGYFSLEDLDQMDQGGVCYRGMCTCPNYYKPR